MKWVKQVLQHGASYLKIKFKFRVSSSRNSLHEMEFIFHENLMFYSA